MARFFETAETEEFFAIPARQVVVFPAVPMSIEIDDNTNIAELKKIHSSGGQAILLTLKDSMCEPPYKKSDFYGSATTVYVTQLLDLPDGKTRAMVVGNERAVLMDELSERNGYVKVMLKRVYVDDDAPEAEAALNEAKRLIDEYLKYMPRESQHLKDELEDISSVGYYADYVAANLFWDTEERMKILASSDPIERMMCLLSMLRSKLDILSIQQKIRREVKKRVDKNQREYYLNEQLKVIRGELGEESDTDAECEKYLERIKEAALSQENAEKLTKEAQKLKKMPFSSVEYGVICNYLDVCLDIPWGKTTEDRVDIKSAKEILERDHDGLAKVKERILEYLSVKQLSPNLRNQIICLVGPPGTGKTSIANSIAEAMNRKYVRVSLGGVRDEADIRGHRKTYVGAMPGRIVNGLIKAGTQNPLMLLDEIDKMTRDSHGDPASAMMEVLDAEQNKSFRDHFVEMNVDLSDIMFIATANSLDTIPRPLLDRMEIIELKSYSMQEKLSIAKRHLIPKQLKKHGLLKKQLKLSEGALKDIITRYTHEAGVRNLEREIGAICRKCAQRILEGSEKVEIGVRNLPDFLGAPKLIPEKISVDDEVGIVNGLAYTELGGTLLKVEVASMPGSGKMEFTGSLGKVMQESAKTAVSYIRSHATELSVETDFYKEKDIHFHFPEGAVPKDGPSAGVTMVCALVSELSGRPVRRDVAMTGEVTLRGRVLAIGGLKEKSMAAYRAGVKTVLIPEDNMKDIEEFDDAVKQSIKFIPCKMVSDVLKNALVL
ncbi:MAG: endopeptidase La [Clostridia bacterium]|nr:endopeptidase La [Clostridia bacterium]